MSQLATQVDKFVCEPYSNWIIGGSTNFLFCKKHEKTIICLLVD